MIAFNNNTKQVEITDNYSARLKSSRIMTILILVMACLRIYFTDWNNVKEMDYLFCVIGAVFLFFVYKNFFVKTAIDKIDKHDIKFIRMPKGFGVKVVIFLNNRKTREVYGYRTPEEKAALRKLANNAKITVKN